MQTGRKRVCLRFPTSSIFYIFSHNLTLIQTYITTSRDPVAQPIGSIELSNFNQKYKLVGIAFIFDFKHLRFLKYFSLFLLQYEQLRAARKLLAKPRV